MVKKKWGDAGDISTAYKLHKCLIVWRHLFAAVGEFLKVILESGNKKLIYFFTISKGPTAFKCLLTVTFSEIRQTYCESCSFTFLALKGYGAA